MKTRKKLIEVALPLDAINNAAKEEKSVPRRGHPQTLHYWWARRPLAAARAVIFAQMVDDPSSCPELFPTGKAQERERKRLFKIIEDLVQWENTTNEEVLRRARDEIRLSWRRACIDNIDQPRAKELFNREVLPAFSDPFAGGGALPLEAQRLGLEAYASDLNPVAVLICKAMIEIPPKFAGKPPVNPESRKDKELFQKTWRGTQGLAEDVGYYGGWMRDEAEKRIGYLYPKVKLPAEQGGGLATPIAWLWARTVRCPNPACGCKMPMLSSLVISSRAGKACYLGPVIQEGKIRFHIQRSPPSAVPDPKKGYKRGMSGIFECAFCGTVTTRDYVAQQAAQRGLGSIQTAVIAEGGRGRVYLPAEASPLPDNLPSLDYDGLDVELAPNPRDVWCRNFGLLRPVDLFTPRQLAALTTFSDLLAEARERVKHDALAAGLTEDGEPLAAGGTGSVAYSQAVSVYLGCALSRLASYNNSICHWNIIGGSVGQIFARQTIPMSWDFIEVHPLEKMSGNWVGGVEWVVDALSESLPGTVTGYAEQADATKQRMSRGKVVSTDPPYYDNIAYADLSDFFFVWLRRSLKSVYPDLFATLTVPKADELVATPYRHGSKVKAEAFFLDGMTQAMHSLAEQAHPAFPVTLYYAFKQAETDSNDGISRTGWDTFLEAVISAGFAITGTWPMRTERHGRPTGNDTNALASSIVLVCRPRISAAPTATRREFVAALKAELPLALAHLQRGSIAPVDLAQAAIGPGMAVYTRYAKVLEADDSPMSVRSALQLINQALDEVLSAEEQDYDPDTRFAVTWYETHGFKEGAFGEAETLATARGVAVAGVAEAGLLKSAASKVRLLSRTELSDDWDPSADRRPTVWEATQHLIKRIEERGERDAAELLAKLGPTAEQARSLAYRLFTTCERKKWAEEALAYNGLVLAWPELEKLASEGGQVNRGEIQPGLF